MIVGTAATILALLCTEPPRREVVHAGTKLQVATGPRALPQGACTSPALSNLIARQLDRRLLPEDGGDLGASHGDPVVVLHGGPGFDHRQFLPYIWELAADHRVILYDQRGVGLSQPALDCPELQALRRELGEAAVATGRFGAMMEVELVNDGPVTLILERD